MRFVVALVLSISALACQAAPAIPRYAHIFVIVEENKEYDQILDPATAPNIAGLAAKYGNATKFYGEVHPSEANYVALLGGDTFGIHDDDGFSCKAGDKDPFCGGSSASGYVDHTTHTPHLGMQLEAEGLTWKAYLENLPQPGSLAFTASDPAVDDGTRKTALYASKHAGFVNFAQVQVDPRRAEKLVGFDQLDSDLASNRLPNFALIVPNQCNEMHGLVGPKVPPACSEKAALIRRGDEEVGQLVRRLQATAAWRSKANSTSRSAERIRSRSRAWSPTGTAKNRSTCRALGLNGRAACSSSPRRNRCQWKPATFLPISPGFSFRRRRSGPNSPTWLAGSSSTTTATAPFWSAFSKGRSW